MIPGSFRTTLRFEACGAAIPAAAPSNIRKPMQLRILMVIPSALILSIPLSVEKLLANTYNSLCCLSLPAAAWYKEFLPVVLFRWMSHRSTVRTKETFNGLRDCRAVHRHKRHRMRGCLSGGLYPSAQR